MEMHTKLSAKPLMHKGAQLYCLGMLMGEQESAKVFDNTNEQWELLLSDLFAETVKGNREAFKRLYDLTSGRLLAIAVRILKQQELAEEVLQEAYITVWQKADQHRHQEASSFSWMISVVRNRAIDRLRKMQRQGIHDEKHLGMNEVINDDIDAIKIILFQGIDNFIEIPRFFTN